MKIYDKSLLKRLGAGESIDQVCADEDITKNQFEKWWSRQLASRVPEMGGIRTSNANVDILRDKWGIPHIFADKSDDLFFGYGYAMAQDRLWQMDYLRRKAFGRLSEILGPSSLGTDVVARTVGINRVAESEVRRLPSSTERRLVSFSDGVNAFIRECDELLPIEFDLLDYVPERWSPQDSLAIWGEFRWYLTGRLPVIVVPEIAKRILGSGELYRAFLTGEAEEESILPTGAYSPRIATDGRVGEAVSDSSEGLGSNNWVIGGELTASGLPLLASDPHIAFASVSCWYEIHLCGAGFNTVGSGYAGVPGLLFGRNEHVAWGLTNNICAQRDLYEEKENKDRMGEYLYEGVWERSTEIVETIEIKGQKPVEKTVKFTRNGPIVTEIIPAEARDTGPVSLRWVGHEPCDEITNLLEMCRAGNYNEFRESLRTWVVPTFSFGFADIDGNIAYQASGRIPIKKYWDRGYRPGWESAHQWEEHIPFDQMPKIENPTAGWIRSANNRTAPEDFPYPLSGVWNSGYRARRIRELIESGDSHARDDISDMQMDVLSKRAVDAVPGLLKILEETKDPAFAEEKDLLSTWDMRMAKESPGASLFEVFFQNWSLEVAAERFDVDRAPFMSGAMSGLSTELLTKDAHGWFKDGDLSRAVCRAMQRTVEELSEKMGEDRTTWAWGEIHKIDLRHELSGRGDVFQRLDRGGEAVGGSGITVCNTGFDPNYMAAMGANYRLIVDFSDDIPGIWAVDAAGQSGNPGSINYCNQTSSWMKNAHHHLPLIRSRIEEEIQDRLQIRDTLNPKLRQLN